MSFLPILLAMLALAPARGERDVLFRTELASAIASATDDPTEQRTLVRLAWFEGGFRRAVARCEILGDHGTSRGTFQIKGITPYDRAAACGSLFQQAELAVRYIRRSADACPRNEGAMRLALYVSGRCDRGERAAKQRWGGE